MSRSTRFGRNLGRRAFGVLHCTVGDLLVAGGTLTLSVLVLGRGWPKQGHLRVVAGATVSGIVYTVVSEWVHTRMVRDWAYDLAIPLVPPFDTGLTPLLQWLLIPPLIYWLALRWPTRTLE